MRSNFLKTLLVLLAAVIVQGTAVQAQEWERLGVKRVGFQTEYDVIEVGRREGRFSKIKLRVSNSDIFMNDIKVVYGNGQIDDIRIRNLIRAGTETRDIDLEGRDRFIKEIRLVYRKRPGDRGQAVVEVFGRDADRGRRAGNRRGDDGPGHIEGWEHLGRHSAGRGVERDVIQVGRREGRFTKIKLFVSNSDVFLRDLRVVYGNGEADNIRVQGLIRAGTATREIDLEGRDRFIKEIEITYEKRRGDRGRAILDVYGKEAGNRGRHGGRDNGRRPGRGFDWEVLGTAKVGLFADRDVIRVGRKDGQFHKIKLAAQGNDVILLEVRVVYGNGKVDQLPIRHHLREGQETPPLDLEGRGRLIDRVELFYQRMPNFKGSARVTVLGLQR